MNKLSKNIIALSLATTLVLPMVGCQSAREQELEQRLHGLEKQQLEQRIGELEDEKDAKEEKAKDNKESKKSDKKEYCEWCEKKTDHKSEDHIGVCYDCGKEMKVKYMTYNGRSFHCGCVDQGPTENYEFHYHYDNNEYYNSEDYYNNEENYYEENNNYEENYNYEENNNYEEDYEEDYEEPDATATTPDEESDIEPNNIEE